MMACLIWMTVERVRRPKMIAQMQSAIARFDQANRPHLEEVEEDYPAVAE
jgi:hypothetical protein